MMAAIYDEVIDNFSHEVKEVNEKVFYQLG